MNRFANLGKSLPPIAAQMAFASISPMYRRKLQEQIAEEEAAIRLVAICAPTRHRAAIAEAERRRDDLRMTWRAALESVTDDVMTGRWQP
jgi:hypothetical protein